MQLKAIPEEDSYISITDQLCIETSFLRQVSKRFGDGLMGSFENSKTILFICLWRDETNSKSIHVKRTIACKEFLMT